MPTTELHVIDAVSLLDRLSHNGRRVGMAIFSPPYALKSSRYGSATAGSYPNEPAAWAIYTADLMRRAVAITDGAVFAVVDSSLDKRGVYRPAVERLVVLLDDTPSVRVLRPHVWHKNGAAGSTHWPSHHYELVVGCCRTDIERPFYDWTANSQPAKYNSGPGRQRSSDGTRRKPAKQGVKKGSPARPADVVRVSVGGGHMGFVGTNGKLDKQDSQLASSGEAPFPVRLADWFIRGFSKPGGIVLDPCMGTGTTAVSAALIGRNFVGGDVRRTQIEIAVRRLERIGVTPEVIDESERAVA